MGNCLPKVKHPNGSDRSSAVAEKKKATAKSDKATAASSHASPAGSARPAHRTRDDIPDAEAASPEELEKRKEKERKEKLKQQQHEEQKRLKEEEKARRKLDDAKEHGKQSTSPKPAPALAPSGPSPSSPSPAPNATSPECSESLRLRRPSKLKKATEGRHEDQRGDSRGKENRPTTLEASEDASARRRPWALFSGNNKGSEDNDYERGEDFLKHLISPTLSLSATLASEGRNPHSPSTARGRGGARTAVPRLCYDSVSDGYNGSINNYPSDRGYGNGAGGLKDSEDEYIDDHDFDKILKHTVGIKDGGGPTQPRSKANEQYRRDVLRQNASELAERDRDYYSNYRRRMIKARQLQQQKRKLHRGDQSTTTSPTMTKAEAVRADKKSGAPAAWHNTDVPAFAHQHGRNEHPLSSFVSHPALSPSVPLKDARTATHHNQTVLLSADAVAAVVPDIRLHPRLAKATPPPSTTTMTASITALSMAEASMSRAPTAVTPRTTLDRDNNADGKGKEGGPGLLDAMFERLHSDVDLDEEDDAAEVPAAEPEFEFDVNQSFRHSSTAGTDLGDGDDLLGYFGDENDDSEEDDLLKAQMAAQGITPNANGNNDECYQADQQSSALPMLLTGLRSPQRRMVEQAMKEAQRQQDAHDKESDSGHGEREVEEGYPAAVFAGSFPGTGGRCHDYFVDDFARPLSSVSRGHDFAYGEDVSIGAAAREAEMQQQRWQQQQQRLESRQPVKVSPPPATQVPPSLAAEPSAPAQAVPPPPPREAATPPQEEEQERVSPPPPENPVAPPTPAAAHADPVPPTEAAPSVQSSCPITAVEVTETSHVVVPPAPVPPPHAPDGADEESPTLKRVPSTNSIRSVTTQRHHPQRAVDGPAGRSETPLLLDSRNESVITAPASPLRQPPPSATAPQVSHAGSERPQTDGQQHGQHARTASIPWSEVTVATIPAGFSAAPNARGKEQMSSRQRSARREDRGGAVDRTDRRRDAQPHMGASAPTLSNGTPSCLRDTGRNRNGGSFRDADGRRLYANSFALPPRRDAGVDASSFASVPSLSRAEARRQKQERLEQRKLNTYRYSEDRRRGTTGLGTRAGGGAAGGEGTLSRNGRGKYDEYRNSAEYRNAGMFLMSYAPGSQYGGDVGDGDGGGDGGGGDGGGGGD